MKRRSAADLGPEGLERKSTVRDTAGVRSWHVAEGRDPELFPRNDADAERIVEANRRKVSGRY